MLLLAILLAFGTVAAFTTMNNNIRVGQIFSETTTRKEALVFYPDDDDGCNIDDSTNNNEMSSLFFNNEHFNFDYNDSNLDLLDRITHTVSQSTLARLVSAFASPEYPIEITNVNNVRCLTVNANHIEIEAVVCDASQCASLLVPVTFPESCIIDYDDVDDVDNNRDIMIQYVDDDNNISDDIDYLQQCILRNLEQLDVVASEEIALHERINLRRG
jgi:hypothetical protein